MKFEDSYFNGEIRDGFFVQPLMKRAWAAQLEILQEIAVICKRHHIKYFAEWGTLLGTVRHKGFIPWDDDLDIAMLRGDFQRFLHYARQELPEGYRLFDINSDRYDELMARVMNKDQIKLERELLEKFHGFPYAAGVDIFCLDYLPEDKEEEELLIGLLGATNYLGNKWDSDEMTEEEKWENVRDIEEMTNFHFDPDKPIRRQLLVLSDKISASYWDAGGKEVSLIALMTKDRNYKLPLSCYESVIEMPFENIMMPVPVGYDQVLRLRYGDNYMTPVKAWGTHDYPFFKSQIEKLKKAFQDQGIVFPREFDMEDNRCILISSIQYHEKLSVDDVREAGFGCIEINYSKIKEIKLGGTDSKNIVKNSEAADDTEGSEEAMIASRILQDIGMPVCGIVIGVEELLKEDFSGIKQITQSMGVPYLVLDTRNFADGGRLDGWVEQNQELLQEIPFSIYLENGYYITEEKAYRCGFYSELSNLKNSVLQYNELCGEGKFGLCLNVGHANLTGKNLRTFVEEAGEMLKMVHMNDNDGFHDDHQMPLTFTTGRGARSTDIYRLIGALTRAKFRGWMVFDTKGLFERCPQPLQKGFLRLMQSLIHEWEEQMMLELKLNQPRQQLILFGTGKMAYNYMCEWAHKYRPAFMVDNNSALWGQERYGIPIRKPEAILEVPEDQRNVFICNQYYGPVSEQLEKMGVAYQLYNDNYYM